MSLFLHESDSGKTFSNRVLLGTSYTGPIIVSSGMETLRQITYKRLLILNPPGAHAKWGVLTYNEEDCTMIGVTIEDIEKEHARYNHSPRGTSLHRGVRFVSAGAQGYQETGRGIECDDIPACKAGGATIFEASSVEQCGQPKGYGRASYAMSFFGWQDGDGSTPRQPWARSVHIKDVRIVHNSFGLYELRGALLCEWRPLLEVLGGETEYLGTADRDLWHIHNTDRVVVDGHSFEGQRPFDIDGAQSIDITNCSGSVDLRVDGVRIGPVSQDFHWTK